MENKVTIIKDYIFEILERVSRFYIHLEDIKNQFYFNEDNKVNDKLIFINSYTDCLVKYIDIIKNLNDSISNGNQQNDNYIDDLKNLIINLNHLHRYLGHLP